MKVEAYETEVEEGGLIYQVFLLVDRQGGHHLFVYRPLGGGVWELSPSLCTVGLFGPPCEETAEETLIDLLHLPAEE
jgi:hypothetical protein